MVCDECNGYGYLGRLWPNHLANLREIFLIAPWIRPQVKDGKGDLKLGGRVQARPRDSFRGSHCDYVEVLRGDLGRIKDSFTTRGDRIDRDFFFFAEALDNTLYSRHQTMPGTFTSRQRSSGRRRKAMPQLSTAFSRVRSRWQSWGAYLTRPPKVPKPLLASPNFQEQEASKARA
jgi:hypothetical protein